MKSLLDSSRSEWQNVPLGGLDGDVDEDHDHDDNDDDHEDEVSDDDFDDEDGDGDDDCVDCNLLSLPISSSTSTKSSRPLTEEVAVDDKLSGLGGKLKSAAARRGAEADCVSDYDDHDDYDHDDNGDYDHHDNVHDDDDDDGNDVQLCIGQVGAARGRPKDNFDADADYGL